MITNPEQQDSQAVKAEVPEASPNNINNNNNTHSSNLTDLDSKQHDLMMTNPFEGQQTRYDEEFDVPLMPSEHGGNPQQGHPQHQQGYYGHHGGHQQHQGYYQHQQDQWQYHQQQQQHQHMYHQQQQHQHQQGYGHHAGYPPQQGGMYPPNHGVYHHGHAQGHHGYHGHGQPGVVAGQPGGANPNNATPSPTTNSDDSGGDCVNEPKRMMVAHTVHPEPSQLSPSGYNNAYARGVPMVQKRPRQSRRSKKKRDPNEPQKPVSAYALFFRDMQAGIKARNPNASFGEVSKHVASMWDNLDPDHKAAYKKRTENAKKEYLKQLAAYRANMVSKNNIEPYSPYSGGYYKSPYEHYATSRDNSSNGSSGMGGVPGSLGSPSSTASAGSGSGPEMAGYNSAHQQRLQAGHQHHVSSILKVFFLSVRLPCFLVFALLTLALRNGPALAATSNKCFGISQNSHQRHIKISQMREGKLSDVKALIWAINFFLKLAKWTFPSGCEYSCKIEVKELSESTFIGH